MSASSPALKPRSYALTVVYVEQLIIIVGMLFVLNKQIGEAKAVPDERQVSIRMPDIRPDHGEQYLCMTRAIKRNNRESDFVVGFKPKSSAHRVHHMLLYGCQMPGIYQRDSPNFVWDCGAMHASHQGRPLPESTFERGPVCDGQMQILYGWAMDAPALRLPDGVGFKVGGPDSAIDYLVLQVHYGQHAPFDGLPELTDNSGLELELRADNESSGIDKRAGVLLLGSIGRVQPGRSKHEIWCEISDSIDIHPFRYRVHTHKMGVRVLGAKLGAERRNSRGFRVNQAELIGVGDPQQPQMFYPVRNELTLAQGDNIYAACEFNNNQTRTVKIGPTGDDEMCNFYVMYWTQSARLLRADACFSENPRPFDDNDGYAGSQL